MVKHPAPDEIRAAREAASLSRAQAAALVFCKTRAWDRWETGERKMHPAMWELFNIKLQRIKS